MRYSQAEKMEIIKIVEGSELSVSRTLKELDVSYDNDMVEVIVEIIGVDSEKNFIR